MLNFIYNNILINLYTNVNINQQKGGLLQLKLTTQNDTNHHIICNNSYRQHLIDNKDK